MTLSSAHVLISCVRAQYQMEYTVKGYAFDYVLHTIVEFASKLKYTFGFSLLA